MESIYFIMLIEQDGNMDGIVAFNNIHGQFYYFMQTKIGKTASEIQLILHT